MTDKEIMTTTSKESSETFERESKHKQINMNLMLDWSMWFFMMIFLLSTFVLAYYAEVRAENRYARSIGAVVKSNSEAINRIMEEKDSLRHVIIENRCQCPNQGKPDE